MSRKKRSAPAQRRDIHREVTDRIIAAMEQGIVPWTRSWAGGPMRMPFNGLTNRPYRGVNTAILWVSQAVAGWGSSAFYTFDQAKEAAGYRKVKLEKWPWKRWEWAGEGHPPERAGVRAGEKGTGITYWSKRTVTDNDGEEESIPFARMFTVFNADQIDGLPAPPEAVPLSEWERIERAEAFVRATGADIVEHDVSGPCYIPHLDRIRIPRPGRYAAGEQYYADLLHELAHYTGAEHRLARGFSPRGTPGYAREELVAELAAAFCAAHLELAVGTTEHASYLGSWIATMKEDPRFLFTVTADARRAAEYLGAREDEPEHEEEDEKENAETMAAAA